MESESESASDPQIPSHFLCPISLQMMRDPVALPTGITFDREPIERWLFSLRRTTCPVTNQPLPDPPVLTPNHTLRRLIQSWCTLNTSSGIQRLPTPRPPLDPSRISLLLAPEPGALPSSLADLRKIVSESERNRRCVRATPGAVDFLFSLVSDENEAAPASDEAVTILHTLQLSRQRIRDLIRRNKGILVSLTRVLSRSSDFEPRAHAVLFIKAIVGEIPTAELIGIGAEFFEEMVKVLRDRICYRATKAALRALHAVCPWGRNGSKAVEAGAVQVLVELLLEEHERKAVEMMMVLLDELCGCAEGRAELVGHAAGLAVVAKRMARVSPAATERAVRVVRSIATSGATEEAVEEMLAVGVVSKLCLLLKMECEKSVRKMAKEILSLHFNVWRKSPCLSPRLKVLCGFYS